jgi:hypothetical protein
MHHDATVPGSSFQVDYSYEYGTGTVFGEVVKRWMKDDVRTIRNRDLVEVM